jgi:hypothetical protein
MDEHRDPVASDFTASAAAAFLKRLRNHIAHRQLPVAQNQETYTVESVQITFILAAAPLLEWEAGTPERECGSPIMERAYRLSTSSTPTPG